MTLPFCQVHVNSSNPVALVASEVNIPGLYLWHDFITATEEEVGRFFFVL